jgi:DNA-binding MarR family transcriptional regulator
LKVPLRDELMSRLTQKYPFFDCECTDLLNKLRAVSIEIDARMESLLQTKGLSEGKFFVISFLLIQELRGQPEARPSEIAESLGVTRATITGLLDGLERAGLVKRRHDFDDRRMVLVSMTEEAMRLLDELIPVVNEFISPVVRNSLSLDERTTLYDLLGKLYAGCHAQG